MRKLLIADDEPGVRRLVRMTLESDEYEIFEAADGDEALSVARSELPDLILLDVMMPKRSGYDVCRELKDAEDTREICVILLTARAQDADQQEGVSAGADDYFVKPFSPVALVRKVDEVLVGEAE